MFEFKFPDVGEGIHEGEIVNWLVDEGDSVDEDEDIVEVMTDKATVQISAPVAGTIQTLVYGEGDTVTVGEVFVLISPDDEAAATEPETEKPPKQAPAEPEADADEETEPAMEPSIDTGSNGGQDGGVITTRTPDDVLAPPSVRIEARKRGIDLATVEGRGPAGRVTMQDLDEYEPAAPAPRETAPEASYEGFDFDVPSVDRGDALRVEPMSAPRGTTRETAHRSTTLQPHFTHAVTVRADGILEALEDGETTGEATPLAAVVKALAQALTRHPRLNALVDENEDELVVKEPVNVGVAWPGEDGQRVRTVARADEKGWIEIQRVLEEGGDDAEPTVTVAALDDEDAYVSTPILAHPQVTGVVVGSVDEAAVLEDGRPRVGHEMTLSFSFDHRWIDGYDGAVLADEVASLLSNPESMLLG